jgi:regulator of RNase E activity RraA
MSTVLLSLIEQLREFEAALITEGMGLMGCTDSENHYLGREIKLLTQFSTPVVGIAVVLEVDTSSPGHKADMDDYWKALQIIEESSVPQIVVMKSTGSRSQHECVLGDGMAKTLKACGSAGVITDGGIRDVRQVDRAGYPVFASGVVANHSSMVYKLSQEPITISGVSIKNGTLIHGDCDGVTIIPQQYHRGIVNACIASRDFETKVHTFWRRTDKTLTQKRAFVMHMVEERNKYFNSLMEKIEE